MSLWTSPPLKHLLDERLQRARLELMEDHRLRPQVEGTADSPAFAHELIAEKLGSAARLGFDAIEASLRASASDYLAARGLSAEAIRDALQLAGAPLLEPPDPRIGHLHDSGISETVVAGIAYTAWVILCGAFWVLNPALMPYTALAIVLGLIPAALLTRYLAARAEHTRRNLANELPVRLCRLYSETLMKAVDHYEYVVRTIARGGLLLPRR